MRRQREHRRHDHLDVAVRVPGLNVEITGIDSTGYGTTDWMSVTVGYGACTWSGSFDCSGMATGSFNLAADIYNENKDYLDGSGHVTVSGWIF